MAFMKPIVVLNVHNDLTIVDGLHRLLRAPEFGLASVLVTDESGEIKEVPTRSMDVRKHVAPDHPAVIRLNSMRREVKTKSLVVDLNERIAALEARLAEAITIMKEAPILEADDWKAFAAVLGRDETLAYVRALRDHAARIKEFEDGGAK